MRLPATLVATAIALGAGSQTARAADAEAGAELAVQCAACHGAAGISTAPEYPNLAAQKEAYIAAQLKAFRAGARENDLMNAVAAGLSDEEIANLAAHFAALPGAEPGQVADNTTDLDGTLLAFPEDFETTLTRYHRLDAAERKQVRIFHANEAALDAAAKGEDLPDGAYLFMEIFKATTDDSGALVRGEDGQLVPGERAAYAAMEKRAGWGETVPEILSNGDWRYSLFTPAKEHKDGLNEAACLACHQPLEVTDHIFSYNDLKSFAEAR